MRVFLAFVCLLVGMVLPQETLAHGMRTAYVEIVEQKPGQAIFRIRTTIDAAIVPDVPADCEVQKPNAGLAITSTNSLVQDGATFVLHCQHALAGQEIGVSGLGTNISEAVVWVSQQNGSTSSHLLSMARPKIKIPSEIGATSTFLDYVPLGVNHILTGADHLLFLLLLVLLLQRIKPVLIAETAFTISHGLSFSAAALGLIHVSKEATEACIALSLLFLALDVARKDKPIPTTNSIAALALVFGLVHGLGFAGGMSELGMPERHIGFALLGFGMGVELGQIAFLAIAWVGVFFLKRSRFSFQLTTFLTYLAGGLAAYWFLDRTRDCLLVANF